MSTEELKCCPFCGGKAEMKYKPSRYKPDSYGHEAGEYSVKCTKCGITTASFGDEGYAIDNGIFSIAEQAKMNAAEVWNRRAASAAGTAEKDATYYVLKSIIEDGYLSDTNTARGHAAIEAHTKASKVLPCRNQIINSGVKAWPRSCPRCGLAKYCPAGEVIEAHNARSPSCGT
jgi:hypothetical protein